MHGTELDVEQQVGRKRRVTGGRPRSDTGMTSPISMEMVSSIVVQLEMRMVDGHPTSIMLNPTRKWWTPVISVVLKTNGT